MKILEYPKWVDRFPVKTTLWRCLECRGQFGVKVARVPSDSTMSAPGTSKRSMWLMCIEDEDALVCAYCGHDEVQLVEHASAKN